VDIGEIAVTTPSRIVIDQQTRAEDVRRIVYQAQRDAARRKHTLDLLRVSMILLGAAAVLAAVVLAVLAATGGLYG
jgi:hypothetical protein